ncbi:hypothetical protein G3I59_41120 [Amycolatopsis rubida]|uniref:Uncharacterized protein n=1 Tax=Amycolatopsis rubida TaxID=112413 RepID=A0ABX0C8W3_9PSEU|nr:MULTISPECIES: hypothetical protein [Amycolatopsis]MYW96847.1 hypothetical protein [Amycolatopsis rubida]NEC61832.1 hypothetical protein [Amycolatopsis rubida]OAP23681.1 hypothetical protein A4R44_05541 [Amycolatopsis sp. M39]
MTAKADPGEVAAANLAGRLHRSQRGAVLGWFFWAVWAFVAIEVAIAVVAIAKSGFSGSALGAVAVTAVVLVLAIRFGRRQFADCRAPLTVVPGPVHDFGTGPITDDYPVGFKHTPRGPGTVEKWQLRVGGRTHQVNPVRGERLAIERVLAVCLLSSGTVASIVGENGVW